MKKLIYFLIASSALVVFLLSPAMATDITPRCSLSKEPRWEIGQRVYEIKLAWGSDGTDQSEFSISDHCDKSIMEKIYGGLFWDVVTDQGATAPDTYTVTFDNEKGADLLSVTTTSTTKAELWNGRTDTGYPVPVWDVQVDYGDPGDSGDVILLYIRIMK